MKKILTTIALSTSMFGVATAQNVTEQEKMSYALGVSFSEYLKNIGILDDFNVDSFKEAYIATKNNQDLLVKKEEVQKTIQAYVEKVKVKKGAENLAAGQKFLAQNKLKKNVVTTPSGLQYEVLQRAADKNAPKPTISQIVSVTYEGKTLEGNVFDSTEKNNGGKPVEFSLSNLIKGWQEGIILMPKGSKYRFYIPSELAYGENAPAQIGPNQVLIFDIELFDMKDSSSPASK